MSVQSSMAIGNAQASSMGLGKQSANALAITDLMGGEDDQKSMIGTLMDSGNRMKGDAFKQDLMSIGQAAAVTGPGRGTGMSASSSMRGGMINKVI